MISTKAYIFTLDCKDYPVLMEEIHKNRYLQSIFKNYSLQIIAVLHNEINSLPGQHCYCFYIGPSLNHNLMELGFYYFQYENELRTFIEEDKGIYLSKNTIKKMVELICKDSVAEKELEAEE